VATVDAKAILASALEVEVTEIPDDASLDSFEPWDSLAHMKLIMALEGEVGRTLDVEEILAIVDLKSLDALMLASVGRAGG
jgi:acyl carrier protein